MGLTLALGTLVCVVLGLTGAAGSIFAVPALVIGMGWSMQQAAPVALVAVAGSAAIGTLEALAKKEVRNRAALVMAGAGLPAASIGMAVARFLSQRVLMDTLGLVMLVVAVRLFS